jgi:hypothetical protein
MQWSNEPHGGFTKSDKPHGPVISGEPYGHEHINAAIQRRHPSLLNWTERIIRLRKEVPDRAGHFAPINDFCALRAPTPAATLPSATRAGGTRKRDGVPPV